MAEIGTFEVTVVVPEKGTTEQLVTRREAIQKFWAINHKKLLF